MFFASTQSAITIKSSSNQTVCGIELHSRPAHEEEPDLQAAFEDNNYHKPLDPEDFSVDRGWWYRCRRCETHSRIHSKNPFCRRCGFTQSTQGAL